MSVIKPWISHLLRTTILLWGLGFSLGRSRAGSPAPAMLQYNRVSGQFRVFRLGAMPLPQHLNRPSGLEQVIRSTFDPTSNAIRVYTSSNPPGQKLLPTSSDQIFTSVFNTAQNVIQVNCISGCAGGVANLTMPAEFVVSPSGGGSGDSSTLLITKAPQPPNSFYAGPASGASAGPAFRTIASTDLPSATVTSTGIVKLSGDLGSTAAAPQVISTHLTAPLPASQGGTGVTSSATFPASGTVATTATVPASGSCANQVVTAIADGATPVCTTVTSAYVDTTIAKTGADISASNQVTSTHLGTPLPASQGGTGLSSSATFPASGVVALAGTCGTGFVTAVNAGSPSCFLPASSGLDLLKVNRTRNVALFAVGGDLGAQLAACEADLPATGGTCDATALEGASTFGTDVYITKPTKLVWPAGSITAANNARLYVQSNFEMVGQHGNNANNAGTIIHTQAGVPFVAGVGGSVSRLKVDGIKWIGPGGTTAGTHAILLGDLLSGYTPTAGSGLTVNLSAYGAGFCKATGAGLSYAGGSVTVPANTTSYIFLDESNSCAPNVSTTGFGENPWVATVTTNATQVTNIQSWVGTNFANGRISIMNNSFQDFGDYPISFGNSTSTYSIADNKLYRTNGAIDIGLYADGTVSGNQITMMAGATQPSYRNIGGSSSFFSHNVSDRLSTNTTQPDIYIPVLAPGGLISINDNKFGSENLGTNTCRISAAEGVHPAPAFPSASNGIAILRNYFLGVAGSGVSKGICISSPVDGWNISQNQFNAVSTVVDDAQTIQAATKGNSVFGPNTYTANNNMILCTNGCAQFNRVEVPFTQAQEPVTSSPRNNEGREIRNRITYSEDFTQWTKSAGVTITPGQLDPWGTARAANVQRDGSAGSQSISIPVNMTGAPVQFAGGTGQGIVKVWLKAGDKTGGALSNQAVVCLFDNTMNPHGCVGGQPTINLGSWWQYKFAVQGIKVTDSFYVIVYPGGQSQSNAAEDIYIVAVQVSDYDTDYVPTSGAVYADITTGNRYERKLWAAGGLAVGASQAAPALVDGAPSNGKCVQFDAAGNITAAASACGSGGGSGAIKLDYQKAASNWTGSSGDQTIYSTTLPVIPAGACISAKAYWKRAAGSGGITFKWFLGATSANYSVITNGSTGPDYSTATICNDPGSQSSQTLFNEVVWWSGSAAGGTGYANPAENLAAPGVVLKFTANAANTETLTPKGWLIELVQ